MVDDKQEDFIWQPTWSHDAVTVHKKQRVHDGFYKLDAYTLSHRTFAGHISPPLEREQFFRQDAAAVLLFDPRQDQIVLVEQFRVGVFAQREESPWLLELVAGLIEPSESAESTVLREAQEEAGCEINKLIPIGSFYNSPGGFAEKTWVYCGIIDADRCKTHAGVAHEHEDILVHKLDAKKVINAYSNWITSASTVIALQWFASRYQQPNWVHSLCEE